MQAVEDLSNVTNHINRLMNAQTSKEIQKNRLRLKISIESARWLSLQACAFRSHDEFSSSKNQGNFVEMVKLLGRLNLNVHEVVLDNAPKNAKYTSPMIQKEILHIVANMVRSWRREVLSFS